MTGTQLGYLRGRRSGLPTPAWLDAQRQRAIWLLRRGSASLYLAQWLVGLRTLTPRLAGATDFDHRAFTAASAPSAVIWSTTLTTLGYLSAATHQPLSRWLGFGTPTVVAASCCSG